MPIHKSHFWIIIIFAVGVLYLFSLNLLAPDGVYFTGDSGLKSLASQNFATGSLIFDLHLPDPPWIKELWDKGMFPYEEPFIYLVGEKYYISYHFIFSLLNAPFFAAFGYRGLYVIPFLSTIFIWLVFYRLCKKLNFHPTAIAIGLFFLIIPTNLTLYGALYWEHTLSVGLAFAGISLLFPKEDSEKIGVWAIAGSGILSGLSIWFRPEQIFVVIFLALIASFSIAKAVLGWQTHKLFDLGKIPVFIGKRGWIFLASVFITMLFYGLVNWQIYRNIFGVHSIQVLEQSLFERFSSSIINIQLLTIGDTSFFLTNPVTLFLVGCLFFTITSQGHVKYERDWTIWYAFILVFLLGVSGLVPMGAGGKQWGPRFLLLLVPVVVLLLTWKLDQLLKKPKVSSKTARLAAFVSLFILAIAGIVQNPIRGREYLVTNYNLIGPALAALRADPQPIIAISNPYLSQVFQPALGREIYFLGVKNTGEMAMISEAVLNQGGDTFTYICYSFDCKLFEPDLSALQVEQEGISYAVQTLTVKDYGKYTIRKMQVSLSH